MAKMEILVMCILITPYLLLGALYHTLGQMSHKALVGKWDTAHNMTGSAKHLAHGKQWDKWEPRSPSPGRAKVSFLRNYAQPVSQGWDVALPQFIFQIPNMLQNVTSITPASFYIPQGGKALKGGVSAYPPLRHTQLVLNSLGKYTHTITITYINWNTDHQVSIPPPRVNRTHMQIILIYDLCPSSTSLQLAFI